MPELWYVLGALSRGKELKIRDELRREGLECFVPLRYEVQTIRHQRQRMMVPALSGLMFLKGTLPELQEKFRFHRDRLFLRKSTFTNHEDYLTVTDSVMQNFIAVTAQAGEKITYYEPSEIQLHPGDQIRINGGPYDGREGVIMRVKGKRRKQFVVSIPGIIIASVELEPELIELTTPSPSHPSSSSPIPPKDLDKEKHRLFDLAHRLLFEIPTAFQHEKEYYLLLSELKRTASALQSYKGYLPSQETELVLPLYMAAVKLQQDVPAAESRLRLALSKLQPTSLLKLRAEIYLAALSHDDEALAKITQTLSSWKSQKLSPKQQSLLEEFTLLTSTDFA